MSEEKHITKVGKILSRQKNPDRHTLVSIFKPESPEAKKHGVIYMVLEILSSDPTMGRIAKLIEKILIEEYYKNIGDGLGSFESSLKVINEKLSELADEGEIGWIGKINAVIAIFEDDILHITQAGTTEAYMIRDEKIIHITENLSSHAEKQNPLKTFINIVSGNLKLKDKIIISTSEFFYHFSLDDTRRICSRFSPAIAAAYIVKMLRREEIESINTLILEFDEKEKDFNIEDIGKKIISTSEQKIVEGYKNIAPFWKKFLRFSEKGIKSYFEKSKDIYDNKIAPSFNKFTKEASKKVNEKIEKISEKNPKKENNITSEKNQENRDLLYLIPDFKKGKKETKQKITTEDSQQHLFKNSLDKNKFQKTKEIFKKIKTKAKTKGPIFMILGILLIVLLVFSGLISYQKKVATNKRQKIEQSYASIKTKVESAIKANELGDTKKAQELLEEVKIEINEFPSAYMKAEIVALEKQIQESVEKIFNIQRFDSIEPITDFSSLDPTIKLTNIFSINNKIFVIDKERHKAAFYNTESNNPEYLDNLSFDGIGQKVALLNDKNSVAILASEPSSIFIYNSKTNSTEKTKQITDEDWPKARSVSSYLNNIYLLVPDDGQIYKYSSLIGSYSNKNNYILNPSGLDLKNSVDMAIDGSIYVLMNDGNVLKFLAGEKIDYTFTGIPSNANEKEKNKNAKMVSAIRIITDGDMKDIYVADAGAKRILVFDKESGHYKTQYISSKWTDIKDIWVSNNKIYILSGSEIYSIDTK
uniref:PPM-type phosphatase domain-containing protein n=1 Tax=candidate division CPR3 bacterium TaxID=2268181 RepID=A0A7C4LZB9_UNCC3